MNKKSLFEKIRTLGTQEWVSGLRRENTTCDWCRALPKMPEEPFQKRFVGQADAPAMQQAFDAVELFKNHIQILGGCFNSSDRVLDFGCGWGRISQALYRYFVPNKIISADIQSEAVEFCRESGLETQIIQVQNGQLAEIANNSIHHIFSFSVFSHLSEDIARNWMKEFYRILVPGGFVAVTTRSLSILRHVQNLQKLSRNEIPPHAKGLIEAFKNSSEAIEDFNNGRFVFREYPGVTKAGVGYGEAIIPESYVRKTWQPVYGGPCAYVPECGTVNQSTIILRKACSP